MQLGATTSAQGLPRSVLANIFQKSIQIWSGPSSRGRQLGATHSADLPARSAYGGVLETIEGAGLFEPRIFWSHRCAEDNPCILHEGWKQIKPKLTAMMEVTTLQDLVRRAATARRHKRGR